MEITKIEEAVAVLNQKRWRGRDDWRLEDNPDFENPYLVSNPDQIDSPFYEMPQPDGIAIVNYLLMRERLGELEQENAGLERRLGVAREALARIKNEALYVEQHERSGGSVLQFVSYAAQVSHAALTQLNAVAGKGETVDAVQGQSGGGE